MDYSKCCLVFGVTPNLAFAVGTFIVGFIDRHPGWNGSIHVFHSGLSGSQMDGIRRLWDRTTFQLIDQAVIEGRLVGAGQANSAVRKTIARYSTMYFAKFEMFDLLRQYEKCVWFDVDMLVQRPIPDLWDFEELAWRPVLKRTQDKHKDLRAAYADVLSAQPVPRPNGGLICATQRLWRDKGVDAQTLYDLFSDIIRKKPIVTGDEMSLMLLAASRRLHVRILSMAYNCPSGSRSSGHAFVVHSIGRAKFWNDGAVSAAFPDWRRCYEKWVQSGGEPYEGPVEEEFIPIGPSAIISAARARKQRRAIIQRFEEMVPRRLCPDPFQPATAEQWFLVAGCSRAFHIVLSQQVTDLEVSHDVATGFGIRFMVRNSASARERIDSLLRDCVRDFPGFMLGYVNDGAQLCLWSPAVESSEVDQVVSRLADLAHRLMSFIGEVG
jgi:lipopolysaccharide biosynthesis glycosyltransferase